MSQRNCVFCAGHDTELTSAVMDEEKTNELLVDIIIFGDALAALPNCRSEDPAAPAQAQTEISAKTGGAESFSYGFTQAWFCRGQCFHRAEVWPSSKLSGRFRFGISCAFAMYAETPQPGRTSLLAPNAFAAKTLPLRGSILPVTNSEIITVGAKPRLLRGRVVPRGPSSSRRRDYRCWCQVLPSRGSGVPAKLLPCAAANCL